MSLKLSIVVPCYNEEEVLPATSARLLALLSRISDAGLVSPDSHLCFVDDGSKDRTWALVEAYAAADPRVRGIKLSRNCGHQRALLAGLMTVEGDIIVSIDADLQDDVDVVEAMVRKHVEGADIVYGVRASRESDTAMKRGTAQAYYRLLELMGVEIVYNHADYRLLSRRALTALGSFSEVNLFLRGIIPLLGFRTASVEYVRTERFAGESKYPFRRMLGLAVDGITSFSVMPLRLITILGLLTCGFSLLMVVWIVLGVLLTNNAIPGWASSVVPIYLIGGVQLFSIGLLGEYVGKVYMETKRRPRYFIEKIL
jgi:glycosyltransferase involved in cell wall biosynthesis